MNLSNFTIYGERCSGTNYLESVILSNFDVNITWNYGWKHFFGFQDNLLSHSDDTLFIFIVRDLHKWINSFYREKHHLPLQVINHLTEEEKIHMFLNDEFWSFDDNNRNKDISHEIMGDRNMYTGDRYKNIFELRHTKLKFLLEDMPKKVNNYIFIRYEDLINDFENTMINIKNKGLKPKDETLFPIKPIAYKTDKNDVISKKQILENPNLIKTYENMLGYI